MSEPTVRETPATEPADLGEAMWASSGGASDLRSLLADHPQWSDRELRDALRVDQQFRWRTPQPWRVDEYLALARLLMELGRRDLAYDYKSVDGPGRRDLALLYDRHTAFVKLRPDLMGQYEDNPHWRSRTSTGQTAFPRRPLLAECEVLERVGSAPLRFFFMVVHLKAFGDAASRARRELSARVLAKSSAKSATRKACRWGELASRSARPRARHGPSSPCGAPAGKPPAASELSRPN